jgi:hypothetical protein
MGLAHITEPIYCKNYYKPYSFKLLVLLDKTHEEFYILRSLKAVKNSRTQPPSKICMYKVTFLEFQRDRPLAKNRAAWEDTRLLYFDHTSAFIKGARLPSPVRNVQFSAAEQKGQTVSRVLVSIISR